ncbi:actin cortical patch SUR7/pH-response regulator pali [Pisolithus marmoratus]|nr:actin cortical patch SUR7/pH-response regulator pali [Pisolithus marmoratus]
MKGEYCIGGASLLSAVAVLLLIFVHVGQINTSTVPYEISMATLNVSGYGNALNLAFKDPIQGLYTDDASLPLGQGLGLRQEYKFGLYSYCAYVAGSAGTCSNHTVASRFEPYNAITADMMLNYSQYSNYIFADTTFQNSSYLGYNSHVAYYFLLLGTLFASLALFTGCLRRTFLFFISAALAILSTIFILIGAAIWTSLVKKAETINTMQISPGVLDGMSLSYGTGIYLSWAAFACLTASIVPYMLSCCTYRG